MENRIQRILIRGAAIVGGALLLVAFVRFGLPFVAPFALAFAVSAAVRPLSFALKGKTGISEKLWAALIICAILMAAAAVLWFLCATLLREAGDIVRDAGELISRKDGPVVRISDKLMEAAAKIPFLEDGKRIDLTQAAGTALSALARFVTNGAGSIISALPATFFFTAVTIICIFYFSCDSVGIMEEIKKLFGENTAANLSSWGGIGVRALSRFIKAYLWLFLITFALLSVGFLVIGEEYPFLWATLAAIVDILPIFGVGTVLVPFSAVLFVMGETGKGIGMLLLFFAIYVIRQILEPRLVGAAAGVHPVFALAAVFAGFKIAGVAGLIAAPVILNAVCILWEEKRKKL